MVTLGIYLRVKFRALFVDFGTTEKAFTISIPTTGNISWMEIKKDDVPDTARQVFNQRGITLKVW